MSVSKFTVLSVESLNPEHPLHDEFTARMDDIYKKLFAISLADSSAIGFMEVEHATGGA